MRITMAIASRQSPVLRLAFFWLQLHFVQARMKTLEAHPCISSCFKSSCDPNYDASCVCKFVLDPTSANETFNCIQKTCNTAADDGSLLIPTFAQECSIFLNQPLTVNGSIIQTLSTPTVSGTRIGLPTFAPTSAPVSTSFKATKTTTPTTTPRSFRSTGSTDSTTSIPDLETLTSAPSSSVQTELPTTIVTDPRFTAEPQFTEQANSGNGTHPLIAAFVLGPIAVLVILVAIFFVWRRRKNSRRSIASFTGVDDWNTGQSPTTGGQLGGRNGGEEEQATSRPPPRSMNQVGNQTVFPLPAFPPPIRQPSMGMRNRDVSQEAADKALPNLPPARPITTISEVSEVSGLSEGDEEAYRTMDSELQRVFLEVRQGYRPNSSASSGRTSMDWSMMIDTAQERGAKGPGSPYSEVSSR